MKMFIDTHSVETGTFPENLSAVDFAAFHQKYNQICREEGVINMRIAVGMSDGRAFCVNLAKDAEAVKRVHDRAGLPFDTITEVVEASQFALFAASQAA
jgi:Protein of unknown function (DUF4242)